MGPQFFVAWGLFSPAKAMVEENAAAVGDQEGKVSLELSLSFDHTSTSTVTDEGKGDGFGCKKSSEVLRKDNKMESGPSLELTLAGVYDSTSQGKNPETDEGKIRPVRQFKDVDQCSQRLRMFREEERRRPTVGGLSLELSLGLNNTCSTSKKRARMENKSSSTSSAASSTNKRSKVERQERRDVALTESNDPWRINKKLNSSDIGHMSRLLLNSEWVESNVFPFWTADQLAEIKQGLPVTVWDCDTDTEHQLVYRQWNNGANVLIKNWVKDFVKRRDLKAGDEIGLYWDERSSGFKFSLLNPVPRQ